MPLLLRTEIRVFANLFLTSSGRRELVGLLITTGCIAFGSTLLFRKVFGQEELVQAILADSTGTVLRTFLGIALAPAVMLAFAFVMNSARSGLFERPESELLLASPMPARAGVQLVFWRSMMACAILCVPLALPPVWLLSKQADLGLGPVFMLPLALIVALLPVIAVMVAVEVILMRWFADPRLKLALQLIGGLIGVVFTALAVIGFVLSDEQVKVAVESLTADPRLPTILDAPAQLLLLGSGTLPDTRAAIGAGALLVVPLLLMRLVARLYPRAHENARVCGRPLWRPRTGKSSRRGAPWPTRVAASAARRELAQFLQEPGGVFAYLFLGILIVWASVFSFGETQSETLPAYAICVFQLLVMWTWTLLITGMLVTPFVAIGELNQLPLLASSPAPRDALLRGRMFGIVIPYVLCLLVALVTAAVLGRPPVAILIFTLAAVPVVTLSLGIILAVATFPIVSLSPKRSSGSDQLAAVVPQIVVGAAQLGILLSVYWLRTLVKDAYGGSGILAELSETTLVSVLLAGTWIVGIGIGYLGFRIGVSNTIRALGPARE